MKSYILQVTDGLCPVNRTIYADEGKFNFVISDMSDTEFLSAKTFSAHHK